MKILIKECKKIMDIRVLLVIAVFTVLFYQLFLEVTIYPAGGQTTNSPYDMPFYAELIESWGTSLPREDWSKLDEKEKNWKRHTPGSLRRIRFLQMQKLRIIRNFRRHGKHFLIRIL